MSDLLLLIGAAAVGMYILLLTLKASEGRPNTYHPLKTVIDRSTCPGADDPEERCPYPPEFCVCWDIDADHPMVKRARVQP